MFPVDIISKVKPFKGFVGDIIGSVMVFERRPKTQLSSVSFCGWDVSLS